MKKVLSIALSVMLLLSALSVLMILPATANGEIPDAPVNLIVNGDFEGIDTDGDGIKDKTVYTQEDQDASSYSGEMMLNAPIGWRANTATGNVKTTYPSAITNLPEGYLTNYDRIAATINRGQVMYQEIEIEAGKTYTVSATTGFRPYEGDSTKETQWGIHMYLDTGKGLDATTRLTTEGDWCAINKMTFEMIGDTGYCGAGDFVTKSFTFKADDFIAANNLTAKENGKYHARLVFYNYTWGISYSGIVDNVTMYEITKVSAADGGSVNTDVAYAGCKNTLIASPYYGNTFAGWYQGETLVSTDATYTGVVTGDITAKFNVYNQIVDGNFESANGAGIAAINAQTNRYDTTHISYNATAVAPGGSTAAQHGNYVAEINLSNPTSASNRQVLNFPVTIEKNKTYYFEYSIFCIDTATDAPKFDTFLTPATAIAWNTNNIVQYTPNFTFNWFNEKSGVSTNGWSWIGTAGAGAKAFTVNKNVNFISNEWSKVRFIFESGESASLFGDADSVTIHLQIGAQGSASTAGMDLQLDNLFFGEAATTLSAPSATEGGFISGASVSDATPMYIKTTAGSSTAYTPAASDTKYYPVLGVSDVLTAVTYYGNSFAGWYDANDNLITTDATYAGGKPGVVAKFNNYNQVINGDFENGTNIGIVPKSNSYKADIKTEDNGNKYVNLVGTAAGADLYAWSVQMNFKPNTKYVLSYDMRTGRDENGTLLSSDAAAYRTIMLQGKVGATVWADPLFKTVSVYRGGSNLVYTDSENVDLLPSGGSDLTPVKGSTSYVGLFTSSPEEWTHYSLVIDTSEMTLSNGTTFTEATDYVYFFGLSNACSVNFDIDNLVVSEVANENAVHYGSGAIGVAYIDKAASTAILPVTYNAAVKAPGYKFTGWTDVDGNVVSTANPYKTFDAAELTANFEFEKLDLGDNGDFEDDSMLAAQIVDLNKGASAEFGTYTDADKALAGYEADMGDKFLKVTANPDTGHIDIGFKTEFKTGNKYIAHAKFRVLSLPETVEDGDLATSSRFDIRIDTTVGWTGRPEGLEYKATGRVGYGEVLSAFSTDGSLYWNWLNSEYGYVDLYWVIDATALTADTTAFINVGLRNGGVYAIDNFSVVNTAELAPTMKGAMIDVDGSTVHYVTGVDLPAFVSMNRVTTHMIAKYFIDNNYPDRAYDFDYKIKEAGFASMRADEETNHLIKDADGNVVKSGNFYTTYEGFDALTPTARILARTEIELTDNFGNPLNVILSTNNTDADKAIENGVYSRSLTQIKRLAAKAFIEGDADAAALAETMIDPVDSRALWNCDIDQVWAFVLAANELQ